MTTAIKLSILALYYRIFETAPFRKAVIITSTFAMCWFISTALVSAMACLPAQKFWEPSLPGHCVNFNVFTLANGILELFIDLAIVLLPIQMILGLQLSRRNQFILCFVFSLAGL